MSPILPQLEAYFWQVLLLTCRRSSQEATSDFIKVVDTYFSKTVFTEKVSMLPSIPSSDLEGEMVRTLSDPVVQIMVQAQS